MANPEHLQMLQRSVEEWNTWREQHRDIRPDLSNARLFGANLDYANLTRADLRGANLHAGPACYDQSHQGRPYRS